MTATEMTVIHHQNDRYKSDLKNNGHFGHEFSEFKPKMAMFKIREITVILDIGHFR